MKYLHYFKKYGFLIVILFTAGILTPEFSNKVHLIDLDLVAMANTKSGSNATKQVFWLFLFLLYWILLIKNFRNNDYIQVLRSVGIPIAVLIFLFIVSVVSATWSDLYMLSVKRSIFQGILYFVLLQSLVFAVLSESLLRTANFLIWSVIVLSLISVVLGYGINPYNELSGFAKNKNEMGTIISFTFIFSYLICDSYSVLHKFTVRLIVMYILLLFTQSMTCIVATTIFFTLFHICKNRNVIFTILSVMTVFLIGFYLLIPMITYSVDSYWHPGVFFEPDFLTGRGVIWDNIYHEIFIFKKMTLGYGYGSYFGTGLTPFYFDDVHSFLRYINSSHNGYIELLTQFGMISIPICLVLFFCIFIKTNAKMSCAMIFPIIHNITEPSIMRDQHIVWIMTIFILVASYIDNRKLENNKELINE